MIKRKYNIDNNYFEKIDTESKAYILGLMYADGCVYSDDKQTKWAKLDLKSDDKYLLEKIAKEMKNECPIRTHTYDRKEFFSNQDRVYEFVHSMSRLQMRSDKIVDDLIKLGCPPRKTFEIKFPSNDILPEKLLNHFIRGYFDGDGSISYSERKSTSKIRDKYLHFCITFTGTYNLMTGIKQYLNSNIVRFIGDMRSRWNNGKNNYTLSIDGNDIIEKVLDWLYQDSTIFLDRKYQKYLLLKEEIVNRNNSKLYSYTHRNPVRNEPFNIYKNGVYIGTCNNRRKLERESKDVLGEHISRCSFTKCLNGIATEYHGFKFIFVSDDIDIEKPIYICSGKNITSKDIRIAQYDLDMNLIKIWNNTKEICDTMKINIKKSSSILSCCKGNQKTALGYIWRYVN